MQELYKVQDEINETMFKLLEIKIKRLENRLLILEGKN